MKTIRETRIDKTRLRLVDMGKLFVGLAIAGDAKKLRIEGTTADEVWTRLHNEVVKTNPKYVGFRRGAKPLPLAECLHLVDTRQTSENYKVTA